MAGFRIPRPDTAFSLDRTSKRKDRRDKDGEHLAFIRKLPCTICGTHRAIEAAHIRYASPAHGKASSAMGQKPADLWAVPLCEDHHRKAPDAQHNHNEREWWEGHAMDPCGLAMALYAISGDEEAAQAIINAIRQKGRERKTTNDANQKA